MPGSKKRKVASDLPDPLELLANFKAAKRSVKTAFEALLSLDLLQCPNELLEKLGENEKLAWLIANFGWNTVSPVGECLRSFPTALIASRSHAFTHGEKAWTTELCSFARNRATQSDCRSGKRHVRAHSSAPPTLCQSCIYKVSCIHGTQGETGVHQGCC